MTTTYTFFREGSGTSKIYCGDWKEEDKNQPVEYRVTISNKSAELYDERDIYRRREPILWASFKSCFSKKKGEMHGYNTTFSFGKHGFWKTRWTFVDTLDHNKEYTWEIGGWETRWELKLDGSENVIAEFHRASLSIKRQGVLTVYQQLPPHLLSCIILTHRILHKRLKEEQARRGAGGS
ncbi:unnamed protein product [Cunninghamella echinulata]